jgi:hypothetical protein
VRLMRLEALVRARHADRIDPSNIDHRCALAIVRWLVAFADATVIRLDDDALDGDDFSSSGRSAEATPSNTKHSRGLYWASSR